MQTVWEQQILLPKVIFLIIISGLVLAFSVVCSLVDEWHYAQNHKKKIEGVITHFVSENNGNESFLVNGVNFSYPISDNIIGYNLTTRDSGSVIQGNSQYVRLAYYNRDNVNVIIKIECEVNETNSDAE